MNSPSNAIADSASNDIVDSHLNRVDSASNALGEAHDAPSQVAQKKVAKLVLDSGAIFKQDAHSLASLGETFVTIPAVIAEIKDSASKERLAFISTLLNLQTIEPSQEAIEAILSFAKKTGDASILSLTDVKVLALTWMLEVEVHGRDHIMTEPLPLQLVAPAPVVVEEPVIEQEKKDDEWTVVKSKKSSKSKVVEELGEEEGWITPGNIGQLSLAKSQKPRQKKNKRMAVACLTTDFAMQNVLLQMKLKLVSIDGMAITKLKSWALRCHACFKVTKIMDKQFCPSCGNAALLRVSIGIDAEGKVTCYLKRNFQYNNRGTHFSIPKPKGGKSNAPSADMILRPDQKEYHAALKQKQRLDKAVLKDAQGGLLDLDHSLFSKPGFASPFLSPTGKVIVGNGRKNLNDRNAGPRRK